MLCSVLTLFWLKFEQNGQTSPDVWWGHQSQMGTIYLHVESQGTEGIRLFSQRTNESEDLRYETLDAAYHNFVERLTEDDDLHTFHQFKGTKAMKTYILSQQ